jgi:hypothetical protein
MSVREHIAENPFYVLGLSPEATRIEIEREGQKLLGMIELGMSAALAYPTPLGSKERTSDMVRRAMAELRDPEKRLVHEQWARLEPKLVVDLELDTEDERSTAPAWKNALAVLGWGER